MDDYFNSEYTGFYADRKSLIVLIDECWSDYVHFGQVPDMFERMETCFDCHGPTAPSVVAAPSPSTTVIPDVAEKVAYVLVEFACSKTSRLGRERYSRHDGKLVVRIRLTEEMDMTSARGINQAFRLIEPYVGKVPVFLWGSLPCTVGSPWQKLNAQRPGWEARRDHLAKQFLALHKNFMKLANYISKHTDGHVCYEWLAGAVSGVTPELSG